MFTSDITTAFLQGKNFDKDSNRVIWIRLPREAKQLLGMEPNEPSVMLLVPGMKKPPNAFRVLGKETFKDTLWTHASSWCIDHYLQTNLYMDPTVERELACIFGIHVVDLVGGRDLQDPYLMRSKRSSRVSSRSVSGRTGIMWSTVEAKRTTSTR